MTAPDPLECLNSRAAAERTTCGEPGSAHCEGCTMCPGACTCYQPTPLDNETLRAALDSYAVFAGAVSWQAYVDVTPDYIVDGARRSTAAAIAPLQARIRRLTVLPSARELVDAWSRRTPDEQLALAGQFLERQEHALRCAMGRCTTKAAR